MGTHSRIGKLLPNGKVRSIYCHYDGYVQGGVGEDLIGFYREDAKIDALLDLGNLSGLGKEIGEKQDFYDFPSQNPNWCLAYERDRGQNGQEATHTQSEEAYWLDGDVQYIYLYKNGEWYYLYNGDTYSKEVRTLYSAFNKIEDEDE